MALFSFRSPKTLPNWIELDYHRRRRPLQRWHKRLTLGALLLGIGVVAATLLTPGSRVIYQSQPVTQPHRYFNHDCAQCHKGRMQTAKRLLLWDNTVRSVPDHACANCHAAPEHNAHVSEHLHCAVCHREHQGRSALASVADYHCTGCHASLKDHHRSPENCRFLDVTGFPNAHPEAALWRDNETDTAQLHFNHQAHLNLAETHPNAGRQLSCADCHELDAAGAYVKPIRYEKHCAACHPLSIQLSGEFPDQKTRQALLQFNREPAPHAAPERVRAVLRDRLLEFVRRNPLTPVAVERDVEIPGPPRPPGVSDLQWKWVNANLTEQEKRLFVDKQLPVAEREMFLRPAGCRQCHVERDPQPAAARAGTALPSYLPTNLRARWMPHARFSHKSHRSMDCAQCHDAERSTRAHDVLMPKLQSCAECHNPKVGVPSDCATCHTYHPR